LIALIVALGIGITTPRPTHAFSVFDLILRGIQIIQIDSMSDEQEVALGRQINDRMVGREFRLHRDRDLAAYVDQIGQRMASASSRPQIPYTFQVVNDRSINAFATMGGYVYVTTGLVAAADNEAQLASVLGHEVGHIASRHAIEQMREMVIAQGLANAAGLDQNTAVNIGMELALRRPASRDDEFEADERGLRALSLAGYAPSAMPAFMQKLVGQPSPPTFLSTHPAARDRVRRLEALIAEANLDNTGDGLDEAFYQARVGRLR
jgi:predicted Zn-dependent protease